VPLKLPCNEPQGTSRSLPTQIPASRPLSWLGILGAFSNRLVRQLRNPRPQRVKGLLVPSEEGGVSRTSDTIPAGPRRWRAFERGAFGPWAQGLPLVLLGAGISSVTLLLQQAGAFQLLELALFDHATRAQSPLPGQSRAVLVTVDEQDLARLGQWPMSDRTLAQVLTKIKQQKPRVIGLDLYRNLPVAPGGAELDQLFKTTPNLVGIERRRADDVLAADIPAPKILAQQKQVASSNILLDFDGRVRRHLLSMRVSTTPAAQPQDEQVIQDSAQTQDIQTLGAYLALAYLAKQGIYPQMVSQGPHESALVLGKARFESLQPNSGGYVRTDATGYQVLGQFHRYQKGPERVLLRDLMGDRIPLDRMQGRIVILGSTAESLRDQFYTPHTTHLSQSWSGLEIHANVADQIVTAALEGHPLMRPVPEVGAAVWTILWSAAGIGLGFWCQNQRSRPLFWLRRSGWFVAAIILMVGTTYVLFVQHWWLVMVPPAVAFGSAGLLSQAYLVWRRLQRSYQALASYSKILALKVQERTHELVEKNHALELSNQQAQAASQAKSLFLTNMSHEFRTPLTVILGFSELLSHDPQIDPEQREQLLSINRSGEHLLSLINDVLEVSRIEAGKLQCIVETFDLAQLIQGVGEMFRYQCQLKGLRWQLETLPEGPYWVKSDAKKLRQILINLLGNALKFTHSGQILLRVWLEFPALKAPGLNPTGPAAVSADQDKDAQSQAWAQLHCQIQDTGIGISAAEQTQIFEPFFQANANQKLYGGSGLGLAITQQFVLVLGGTISVESNPGEGSQFLVQIPLQLESAQLTGLD
jgi:adenylate cyclase